MDSYYKFSKIKELPSELFVMKEKLCQAPVFSIEQAEKLQRLKKRPNLSLAERSAMKNRVFCQTRITLLKNGILKQF